MTSEYSGIIVRALGSNPCIILASQMTSAPPTTLISDPWIIVMQA